MRLLGLVLLLRHRTRAMDTRGQTNAASDDIDGALDVQPEEHALECSNTSAGIFVCPCVAADRVEEHVHAFPGFLLCRGPLWGSCNDGWCRVSDARWWSIVWEGVWGVGKGCTCWEARHGGLLWWLLRRRRRHGRGGDRVGGGRRIGCRGGGGDLGVTFALRLFSLDSRSSATPSERQVGEPNRMRVFRDVAYADLLGIIIGLVTDGCLTPLSFELSTGDLSDALWVLLDILLSTAARVTGTYELGVIFETWGDRFAAMGVALHELDHLRLLFTCSPFLKGFDGRKHERVPVVAVS